MNKFGVFSIISSQNTVCNLNSLSNSINYFYDNDNKATSIKWDNDKYVMYNYDRLSRLQDKYLKSGTNSYKTSMTYVNDISNPLKTTTMLASITNGVEELSYTYDDNGNIERILKDGALIQKYYYDGINQLIREDNVELNQTITYTYDTGGNIQTIDKYDYTTDEDLTTLTKLDTKSYTYDVVWKDKLINYNGKDITYDNIGNPLTYDGNTYTWQNGRQLVGINKEGTDISYKYNDNGIRTQKTVNGVTTDYYLEGDKVIYETTGNNTIYYTYDAESNLIGFKYNNDQYYYVRNGQGDIIGILDNNLNNVISYTYDTWGMLVSIKDENGNDVIGDQSNIGNINPYLYRGYRYDKEIGMYYLQSRYYNPETCRMLNMDSYGGDIGVLLSHNTFAYCCNNPINNYDPSGNSFLSVFNNLSTIFSNMYTAIATVATVVAAVISSPIVIAVVAAVAIGAPVGVFVYNTVTNAKTEAKAKTKATTITAEKTKDKSKYQYQEAELIGDNVVTGKGLTYSEAKLRVDKGLNVMAVNEPAAYALAKSYRNAIGPEIDKNQKKGVKYYYHYHPNSSRYNHIWIYEM